MPPRPGALRRRGISMGNHLLTSGMSRFLDSLARVESVNVGMPRQIEHEGRLVTTAIWKQPVPGRSVVRGVNVAGDEQGDRTVHGGVDKAVYAYSSEDYEWWRHELGRELTPGAFGENVTTVGIDISNAVVGQRWTLPDLVLEVSQPRLPCFKLGMRMGDAGFPEVFKNAARFGTYLRIIREGTIGSGDPIEVGSRPSHGLTVSKIGESYPIPDPDLVATMLEVPQLPDGWRNWAERAQSRLDRPDAIATRRANPTRQFPESD